MKWDTITYFAIKVEKIIKEKIPSLNNITIEVNKKNKTVRNLSNCFYFIILLPKTNIKANKAINTNL